MSEEFWLDTYTKGNVSGTVALKEGGPYRVVIQGTLTPWNSFSTKGKLSAEPEPLMWPTPGRTQKEGCFDPEFAFAWPAGSGAEKLDAPSPRRAANLELSLDGGKTWAHPTTATPYNSDHRYTYEVVGQGAPLMVRFRDNNHADNSGRLKLIVTPAEMSMVVVEFDKRQRRKRVRQLSKGKLMSGVNELLTGLRNEGVIEASAQPVVVIVRKKRHGKGFKLSSF